jgi:hypothetical protein
VDGKLKKLYIRKADAEELWGRYLRQREVRKRCAGNRKQFIKLCKELRQIGSLLSQPSLLALLGKTNE